MHNDSLTTLAMESRQGNSPEQGTTAGCYNACYYDISCDLSCILLPAISGRHRSTWASIVLERQKWPVVHIKTACRAACSMCAFLI